MQGVMMRAMMMQVNQIKLYCCATHKVHNTSNKQPTDTVLPTSSLKRLADHNTMCQR